jgi:hypothetical protein
MSAQSIERALLRLDLPRSTWDGTNDECFDGPDLDGRGILQELNRIALFDPHATDTSCRQR